MPSENLNEELPSLYTLYYRNGSSILTRNFQIIGDIRTAEARGKGHCEKMRFRFLYVSHLISDLDIIEKRIGA